MRGSSAERRRVRDRCGSRRTGTVATSRLRLCAVLSHHVRWPGVARTIIFEKGTSHHDSPSPRLVVLLAAGGLAIGAPVALRSEDGRQPAAKEWATVNGDLGNTRYSTLTQINPQTVGKLAGAWTSAPFDAMGAGRAMPVVRDGLLFITAGARVNAYNAKTGATVWSHATDMPPATASLNEYNRSVRGVPNREGVAVGEGLVFAGLTNSRVIALREKTGEVAWDVFVGIEPARAGQGVSGAPVYANGMVIVGTAGDTGFRGKVVALEAQSGRKAWEWFAVAGPGDPGFKTWPKDTDAWKTGGGAVWLVGAADLDLGLVYFGTGNGVPQYAGDTRAGDNLYLCSVVALEIKTGKLRWHYQTIRHDIWEADIAESPVLFETQIGGRARKGIAAMRTDGYLFMLDRETGKPLMAMEERKVRQDARSHTVATQPYPVGADSGAARLRRMEKTADALGLRARLLLRPRVARDTQPAHAGVGHARGADGLQPADGVFLRHRQLVAAVVPARRGSVHLHSRRRQGARPAAGPRGDGGDRQPHQQDRVETGVPGRAPRRSAGDRRRPAVPDDAGRKSGRPGREDRRRRVAVPDRTGGRRTGGELRDRRRTVPRRRAEEQRLGVQAGGPAAAASPRRRRRRGPRPRRSSTARSRTSTGSRSSRMSATTPAAARGS